MGAGQPVGDNLVAYRGGLMAKGLVACPCCFSWLVGEVKLVYP